jgi:hypothetical protein
VSADPARRADSAVHVSLIGHSPALTANELAELRRILSGARRQPGAGSYLVLHHGCRPGSDEVAHRIVRPWPAWRIEGHPDTDGSPGPEDRLLDDVDVAHKGRPRVQRDAELARIAHVLIMISPCAGDGPQMRPTTLPELPPGQETIDLRQPRRHSTDADRTRIWRQPVYIGNQEDCLPPGKSIRARPAGLPGLGKRRLGGQTPLAGAGPRNR